MADAPFNICGKIQIYKDVTSVLLEHKVMDNLLKYVFVPFSIF